MRLIFCCFTLLPRFSTLALLPIAYARLVHGTILRIHQASHFGWTSQKAQRSPWHKLQLKKTNLLRYLWKVSRENGERVMPEDFKNINHFKEVWVEEVFEYF